MVTASSNPSFTLHQASKPVGTWPGPTATPPLMIDQTPRPALAGTPPALPSVS